MDYKKQKAITRNIIKQKKRTSWTAFLESINKNTPIRSIWQSGFRKGRSTTDQLISMEAEILDTFIERKEAVGIFFDIEKAYDTINREYILHQLHTWGL